MNLDPTNHTEEVPVTQVKQVHMLHPRVWLTALVAMILSLTMLGIAHAQTPASTNQNCPSASQPATSKASNAAPTPAKTDAGKGHKHHRRHHVRHHAHHGAGHHRHHGASASAAQIAKLTAEKAQLEASNGCLLQKISSQADEISGLKADKTAMQGQVDRLNKSLGASVASDTGHTKAMWAFIIALGVVATLAVITIIWLLNKLSTADSRLGRAKDLIDDLKHEVDVEYQRQGDQPKYSTPADFERYEFKTQQGPPNFGGEPPAHDPGHPED